jgi:hypothetical protein
MGLLAEAFDELFNPQHHAYVEPSPLSFGKTLTWPTRLRDGEAAAVLTGLRGDSKAGSYRNSPGLADQIEATRVLRLRRRRHYVSSRWVSNTPAL